MEFRDIERRPVVQQIAEQLRDAVVDAVNRSTQLPGETSLSRALTVSRPTLREALRILEAEGLVSRDHRTAVLRADARAPAMSRPLRSALTVLSRTERITLAEIVDLRATIEERAASRAAEVATAEDLALMEAALKEVKDAAETGGDWDAATFRFHVAMVSASHNEAFLLIMLAAREAAADLLRQAAAAVARERSAGDETPQMPPAPSRQWTDDDYRVQCRIYDAIKDRRSADAAALIRTQLPKYYSPLAEDADLASPSSRGAPTKKSQRRTRPRKERS